MPLRSSQPRSSARASSFLSSSLDSGVGAVVFCGGSSGMTGMLQRYRWPLKTTRSYVSSSGLESASDAAIRVLERSCVCCDSDDALREAAFSNSDAAERSVMNVLGNATSYYAFQGESRNHIKYSLAQLTCGNARMSSKTLKLCGFASASRSTAGNAQKFLIAASGSFSEENDRESLPGKARGEDAARCCLR